MTKILSIKYGGHDISAALEAINDYSKISKLTINDIDEIVFVNDMNKFLREIYLRPAI